jgi:hypothetical protein
MAKPMPRRVATEFDDQPVERVQLCTGPFRLAVTPNMRRQSRLPSAVCYTFALYLQHLPNFKNRGNEFAWCM